jgi:hypothetical protein
MPGKLPLPPERIHEFDRRGVIRIPGLLSADRVCRARQYVQRRLERTPSAAINNKHPDIEGLLEDPALLDVVATLLDGVDYDRTKSAQRPQILVTLPNSDTWTVPTGWHADLPRLASGRRPGVQAFMALDTVHPRGGGTLVVAGSHHLLNDGRLIKVKGFRSLLCREAFFRELYSEVSADADRAHLLGRTATVGDVELEVMELTGAPGDAWLLDPRVLHTGAPNATAHPRIMATHRFISVDVVDELTKAIGWAG